MHEEGKQVEQGKLTRLRLFGGAELVVPFAREPARTYWAQALERGERFINYDAVWVRTDLIYAIEGVRDV